MLIRVRVRVRVSLIRVRVPLFFAKQPQMTLVQAASSNRIELDELTVNNWKQLETIFKYSQVVNVENIDLKTFIPSASKLGKNGTEWNCLELTGPN